MAISISIPKKLSPETSWLQSQAYVGSSKRSQNESSNVGISILRCACFSPKTQRAEQPTALRQPTRRRPTGLRASRVARSNKTPEVASTRKELQRAWQLFLRCVFFRTEQKVKHIPQVLRIHMDSPTGKVYCTKSASAKPGLPRPHVLVVGVSTEMDGAHRSGGRS